MTPKVKSRMLVEVRGRRSATFARCHLKWFCGNVSRSRLFVRKGIESRLYHQLELQLRAILSDISRARAAPTTVTLTLRKARWLERVKNKLFYSSWWPYPVNIKFDIGMTYVASAKRWRKRVACVRIDLVRSPVSPIWFWEHLCEVTATME